MPTRSWSAICVCLLMMFCLTFFHYTQRGLDALTVLFGLLGMCLTAALVIGSFRVRRRRADAALRSKIAGGENDESDPTVWPPPPKSRRSRH